MSGVPVARRNILADRRRLATSVLGVAPPSRCYMNGEAALAKVFIPHHTQGDAVVDRLRRIEGQVAGIRRMYEDGRYCIDVLDQLSAARAGLEAAALLVLEDHVKGCVRDAIDGGEGETKAAELLAAVRRYVRSV